MAIRQYIGARYTIKIYENSLDPSSAEWESGFAYEYLTLVIVNNDAYLSKKDVPSTIGSPALNPTYWVKVGNFNGQIANLQNQIDTINNTTVVASVKTPEQFGAVGDGVTDDTAAFNACFSGGGIILCKKGATYLIDAEVSLFPESNTIIDLNNSVIKAKPNANDTYHIFWVKDATNVTICNGYVVGERDNHIGSTGEWGFGVLLYNSNNVLIDRVGVSKCWGDGICITKCTNAHVENCIIDNNRRQGVSITEGNYIYIKNNTISNTNGTAPESGIDIESEGTLLSNVIIDGNNIIDNVRGLMIDSSNRPISNVLVVNNTLCATNATQPFLTLKGGDGAIIDNNTFLGNTSVQIINVVGEKYIIKNNDINADGQYILYAQNSDSITIKGNVIHDCTLTTDGIYFNTVSNSEIEYNEIDNVVCSANGYFIRINTIGATLSDDNRIIGNNLKGIVAKWAILLQSYTHYTRIFANDIVGTYEYIIYEYGPGTDNDVHFNTFKSGSVGNFGTDDGTYSGSTTYNMVDNVIT